MNLSSLAQKNSTQVRIGLPLVWRHVLKFHSPGPAMLWLVANLFDTVTTLIGFARGHIELNLFAISLGQMFGPYAMFMSKWLVVFALLWLIRVTGHQLRLNFCFTQTMKISTVIVWLGVSWNVFMLSFFS
jgi:hypothetical protein